MFLYLFNGPDNTLCVCVYLFFHLFFISLSMRFGFPSQLTLPFSYCVAHSMFFKLPRAPSFPSFLHFSPSDTQAKKRRTVSPVGWLLLLNTTGSGHSKRYYLPTTILLIERRFFVPFQFSLRPPWLTQVERWSPTCVYYWRGKKWDRFIKYQSRRKE